MEIAVEQTETHRLERTGPQTAAELDGHPSLHDREVHNLLRFNPLSNFKTVWHTADHDPEAVVRKWLEANRDRLESYDVGKRKISAHVSDPYSDAWQAIRGEYEWLVKDRADPERSEQAERPCPRCGKEDVKNLPRHIRACDGEADDDDS